MHLFPRIDRSRVEYIVNSQYLRKWRKQCRHTEDLFIYQAQELKRWETLNYRKHKFKIHSGSAGWRFDYVNQTQCATS